MQVNPGPPKFPCVICSKSVRSNSKAIECDFCLEWTHLKCTNVTYSLTERNEIDIKFTCARCLQNNLPFLEATNQELYEMYDSNNDDLNNSNTSDPSNLSNTSSNLRSSLFEYECFQKKGLHFLHINARSLLNKKDEVHALAEASNAAVLAVSETWLDDTITDGEIAIPGYLVERKDRKRDGGGVCLYIKNNLAYNKRTDLISNDIELIAIDLLLPKTKPILIAACYRPPKDSKFYGNLENLLAESPLYMQQETYLLGDFNTNVDGKKINSLVKSLNSFMKMFSFCQLIEEYTRITNTSASIIDLVIISDQYRVSQSGVIPCGFSDHHIIFCTRKINRGQFNKHNVTQIRSLKNYSVTDFEEKLKRQDWFKVINCENANQAWCNFCQMFKAVIDVVAPVKQVRLKQRTKLWFSGDIINLIRKRDKAQINFKKSLKNDDFLEFKKLRNQTQREINMAKRNFVKNQIEENQSYPKKLWKNLKDLGTPTKSKSGSATIGLKNDNGEIIFDDKFVANKFNHFFCNIAATLVDKLPKSVFDENKIENYYKDKGVSKDSFKFSIVSEAEVLKLLSSLNVTKSTGCDNISARFLKDGSKEIVSPLTYVINLSLRLSEVPNEFKTARVVPLYKKGDCNSEGNYRPVSILPVVSKIFERIVYNQFYSYLCENNLIYEYQSGFRSCFSTDTALTYLSDKIRFNMDQGLYTGVILLDLQKAFDTVDHVILLKKLKAIGACDSAVLWFNSYLSNRKQFVDVKGCLSEAGEVTCGVPQGSILGPLLFTIYVNDMSNSISCDLCLYADDSLLLVSGKDVKTIEILLCSEMEKISNWLDSNKLSLHLGKTESILFASKKKLKKHSYLNINCKGVKIEAKSNVKYLGAVIDQDMSGHTMGNSIIKKVNAGLRFLYRKSGFLNLRERKLLCSALLQSRLDYGYNVYYRGLEQCLKKKLQTAQNKMVRYILGYGNRHHLLCTDFRKVKYLNVESRFNYLSCNMMYNIFHGLAPTYLCTFKRVADIHSHNTRKSENCYVVPHVKSHGSKSFMYNGAKVWNNLPKYIKCTKTKDDFKNKCKKYLFNTMQDKEKNEFVM